MIKFQINFAVLLPSIFIAAFYSPAANATIYSFELEGAINAPIYNTYFKRGAWRTEVVNMFQVNIERGDVKLVYDDRGTSSLADDIVRITGSSSGCMASRSGVCPTYPRPSMKVPIRPSDSSFYAGKYAKTFSGTADIGWDLTLENPIIDPDNAFSTTGSENFSFGMQNGVGSLTVVNHWGNPLGNNTADVSIKNGEDGYAFRLYKDDGLGDGEFRVASWIMLNGGFIPGLFRFESLPGEPLFNSNIIAHLVSTSGTPPVTPPSEVPEPATAALLLLGMGLGSRLRSKRKETVAHED